ncbi:MAG: hypothetical protein KDB24_16390, partial [Microthrixaceae bacterium]|nr:hypothetical protein [Microthrixaceae bacterium]
GFERYVATSQPPLFVVVLGLLRLVAKSRLAMAVSLGALSTVTVGLVWWAARREFGRMAGLFALGFAALYVHVLIQGGLVMSEVLAQLLVGALLVVAPDALRHRRPVPVAALGVLCGLLALTRAELLLLVPVLGLALLARGLRSGGAPTNVATTVRVLLAPAAFSLAFTAVYSPWYWYTNEVLGRPVPSSGAGFYQLATSCEPSLRGPLVGYRDEVCLANAYREIWDLEATRLELDRRSDELNWDEAAQDLAAERLAAADVNMLPVRGIRIARGLGLYRPFDTANLEADEQLQGPGWLANVQVLQWLMLMVLAVPGVIVAWRRRMPLEHVAGLAAATVIALGLGFGLSRYRAALDPAVVLLAGVGAARLWAWARQALGGRPADPSVASGRSQRSDELSDDLVDVGVGQGVVER